MKKGLSVEDGRRHREAAVISIRKDKKQENLAKRRNMNVSAETEENLLLNSGNLTPSGITVQNSPTDMLKLRQDLESADPNMQYVAIKGFRKLLSVEKNPPVQECIDCGAVPMFVAYLQRYEAQNLQFEAAWALTNIASTDRTSLIAEYDAIPHLVALLTSENADLREQCAWCLGNVAGDSAKLRDIVLSHNAMKPLLANIQQPASISLLRNCVWTLSNFCRGKPQPQLSLVAEALPVLASVITQQDDFEAISDAVWALSYLSDGSNDRIQAVIDAGNGVVVPALIKMLCTDKLLLIVPALRTLGNIVSGSDAQTQMVVNNNVLPAIVPLLTHAKKNIRKESCWMLSNIAAGNRAQLKVLMETPNLVNHVVMQLGNTNDWEVRKEAAWVVSNIVTSSEGVDNIPYISLLVQLGAVRSLCDLLDVSDTRIVIVALEALDSILKCGVNTNSIDEFTALVDEAEGIDKLENLQEHENEEVYNKAVRIIEQYFNGEDEVTEDDLFSPFDNENTAPNAQYDFGMPSTTGKAADFNNQFVNSPHNSFPPSFGANAINTALPPPPATYNFGMI